MAYSTSPIVGINLGEIVQSDAPEKDFTKLGLTVNGDDGHIYVLVESDAAHAAASTVGITDDTFVTATGTTHEVPVAVVAGDVFWARQAAL